MILSVQPSVRVSLAPFTMRQLWDAAIPWKKKLRLTLNAAPRAAQADFQLVSTALLSFRDAADGETSSIERGSGLIASAFAHAGADVAKEKRTIGTRQVRSRIVHSMK